MDNKSNGILIGVVVGIVAGIVTLLLGQNALAPSSQIFKEIATSQKVIEQKLTQSAKADKGDDVKALYTRIKALETRVSTLEQAKPVAPVARQAAAPDTKYDIPVGSSFVYGDKNAPVTIVAFKDFQCPFCAKFNPAAMQAVDAMPGKVNYIIKNFPLSFHKEAKSAAKAAMAAGEQGKYYEMAQKILENVRALNEENYQKWAKELGLNVKKFTKDYESNDAKYEKIVKNDMDLGAKIGVRGTPTFFLNGRNTRARTVEAFKEEVEKALKNKKK